MIDLPLAVFRLITDSKLGSNLGAVLLSFCFSENGFLTLNFEFGVSKFCLKISSQTIEKNQKYCLFYFDLRQIHTSCIKKLKSTLKLIRN